MPILPSELLPTQLCLPQDDPLPPQREKELSDARDTYAYSYDKPNLRGVAMIEEVPKSEGADPAWIHDIVGVVEQTLKNGVELEEEEGNRLVDKIGEILGEVRSVGL